MGRTTRALSLPGAKESIRHDSGEPLRPPVNIAFYEKKIRNAHELLNDGAKLKVDSAISQIKKKVINDFNGKSLRGSAICFLLGIVIKAIATNKQAYAIMVMKAIPLMFYERHFDLFLVAIQFGVESNRGRIVGFLLEIFSAEMISEEGEQWLVYAAGEGHNEALRVILDHFDFDITMVCSDMALNTAIQNGHYNTAALLKDRFGL